MVDSKVPFLGFRCELNERVAIMEYDESARAIAVHLSEFCDRSLPYPDMVADAARKAAERIIDLEEKCR